MSIYIKYGNLIRQSILGYFRLNPLFCVFLFTLLILINGCIQQFIPDPGEEQDLLVVEGLITDQPGQNTIKISTSLPVGGKSAARPLTGCSVTISDDLGNFTKLEENTAGIYTTNPPFQGIVGRSYTLHINTLSSHHNLSYQSFPVLMKPVPSIDSIYHEKIVLSRLSDGWPSGEGCQIYLNTNDPDNICKYYRWEYIETWEFDIPYFVQNHKCWVTNYSDKINIKSTASLSEGRIERFPINFVTNKSDRLNIRYSILVNQYSINEDEFTYWEKVQNVVEQVGSLYDITPASIPSNITCNERPDENVLGYFSVSAVKSRRFFINDQFRGMVDLYKNCEHASVGYNSFIPHLNISVWVIIDHPDPPAYKVLTYIKGCADCTVRGTTIKPDFWIDDN